MNTIVSLMAELEASPFKGLIRRAYPGICGQLCFRVYCPLLDAYHLAFLGNHRSFVCMAFFGGEYTLTFSPVVIR